MTRRSEIYAGNCYTRVGMRNLENLAVINLDSKVALLIMCTYKTPNHNSPGAHYRPNVSLDITNWRSSLRLAINN